MKTVTTIASFISVLSISLYGQQVDYSILSVPEESKIVFERITTPNDQVCMPEVRRTKRGITWYSNRIVNLSPDGVHLAFLSARDNTTNVFVKSIDGKGPSLKRTKRLSILDFSYSQDGKFIVFSEQQGKTAQILQTDAEKGYVCRQITTGSDDYSPRYSYDMKTIFFTRQERNGLSVWGYDPANNALLTYTSGINPCPISDNASILCIRPGETGRGEVWRVNYQTGTEECIVSDPERSFSSPAISPDGNWIVMVGDNNIVTPTFSYRNTDIFVCRADGSQFMQLTYHAADDLSPVWDKEGKYIYFVSQRGSQDAVANVWRMTFNPQEIFEQEEPTANTTSN